MYKTSCGWSGFALITLSAMLGSGCGKSVDLVPLHGEITYQGKPLDFGSIMFQPEGGGELARSQIQPGGTFSLTTHKEGDGVKPGRCRVRITAFEGQRAPLDAPRGMEVPLGRSVIPKHFQQFGTSGVVIEVASGMSMPVKIDLQ